MSRLRSDNLDSDYIKKCMDIYFVDIENIFQLAYSKKKNALEKLLVGYIFILGDEWCKKNNFHPVHQGATVYGSQPINVTDLIIKDMCNFF